MRVVDSFDGAQPHTAAGRRGDRPTVPALAAPSGNGTGRIALQNSGVVVGTDGPGVSLRSSLDGVRRDKLLAAIRNGGGDSHRRTADAHVPMPAGEATRATFGYDGTSGEATLTARLSLRD